MPLISKTKRYFLRSVCHSHIPTGKNEHTHRRFDPYILNLPTELLLLIFSLLPFPSQVCFALTCKHMYQLFSSVLDDERLCFPRVFSSKKFEIPSNEPHIPRNQVLTLLQNNRWAYCSGCLKLHPRSEFGLWLLPKPSIRKCMDNAGIEHLCDCISLTPRHQMRLERWLKTGFIDTSSDFYGNARIFQLSRDERGRPYLLHQCSMMDNADANIQLTMTLLMDDDLCFIVKTRYEVRLRRSSPLPDWRAEPFIRCNGDAVYICTDWTLIEIIWCWATTNCSLCAMRAEQIVRLHGRLSTVVQGVRNLGRSFSDRAVRRWLYQSSVTWSAFHRWYTGFK